MLAANLKKARSLPKLRKLGPKHEWVTGVHLVGTAEMARLNEFYRGKKGPTDVLSFEAPEVFREQGLLGELVICLPVMKKQAREIGHPAKEELRVLLVHGLLHLLGQDHEGKGPKAHARGHEMAAFEAKLLSKAKPGLINRAGSSKPKA
ncbi:MAG: rRNA maturation RNase YbeY [Bdellovibrionales bacterium GWB1_55_8]|nr:MAG: rRNA maturation RNase YbeY [Bdellovibrionales bacterium GWB1_55_8]